MAPGRSNSGNPLLWIFVALAAFCCIGVIACGGMGWSAFNQGKDMLPCMLTMNATSKGIREYVKEKGVYPKAESWQDDIAPYYTKATEELTKEMNSDSSSPDWLKDMIAVADIKKELTCNEKGSPKTFLAYNSELGGKKAEDIKDKSETIMIFEIPETGRNLSKKYAPLPIKDSPKMFGQPRGWQLVDAEGKAFIVDATGKRTKVDIESTR
jgi:hypothetical protein